MHMVKERQTDQLVNLLERRNRNLHRVNEVSQRLTSLLDEEAVMGYLVRVSAEIIGAPVSSLWLWEDEQMTALNCRATHPQDTVEALSQHRIHPDYGIGGWVAVHGKTTLTQDAYSDTRFAREIDGDTGFNTKSILAVPLILRDSVIGVLEVLNKAHANFDQEDVIMVETMAAAAAIALENARLVSDLQTQNEELDAFAHTVAHDLKGPLTMVLGYSDMLEGGDIEQPELSQVAGAIARNSRKMDSIIQEILLLSSVRRQDIEFRPINTQLIIQEACQRIDHLTRQYDASLSLPDSWPEAQGYAPWVEEIWVNYLSNAIKYGGRPPQISLGYEQCDNMIWFWVDDNGSGLTTQEQDQLFMPFSRLGHERIKGHGLGLSIVQRIVTKLGGQIAVESLPGQGSRFKFSLLQA